MTTMPHTHDFGDPRAAPIGTAHMCAVGDCLAWAVRHRYRVRWEDPTPDELLAITAHMIEATAIGEAMVIIHGRERGIRRAREVLGYDR